MKRTVSFFRLPLDWHPSPTGEEPPWFHLRDEVLVLRDDLTVADPVRREALRVANLLRERRWLKRSHALARRLSRKRGGIVLLRGVGSPTVYCAGQPAIPCHSAPLNDEEWLRWWWGLRGNVGQRMEDEYRTIIAESAGLTGAVPPVGHVLRAVARQRSLRAL